MSLSEIFGISGSALSAQRLRMDVISSNLANAETTDTPEGGPYKQRRVVFSPIPPSGKSRLLALPSQGVAVTKIVADQSAPKLVYEPDHPDANPDGFVSYPNIDVVSEMVDMLSATRAYEANVTAVNAAKAMAQRALEIGRG